VLVRACLSGIYFKSEVYAVINGGWYSKYLLVVPSDDGGYFKFFEYLDKSTSQNQIYKTLINTIIADFDSRFERFYIRSSGVEEKIDGFEELLDKDTRFFEYNGYLWIYENKELLCELVKGGTVSIKNYTDRLIDYKTEGWNYIESQGDIDSLMEQTCSFHDSVLKDISYVSGSYVDGQKNMYCCEDGKILTMRFDSQCCKNIEMVFEGVTALNLRPVPDNYTSNIYGASLFLRDACIFFCDSETKDIDREYKGTWVEAYNLRWRFFY